MKQVSRRRFLAAAAGLGGISALSGLGWLGSACSDDDADDGGLILDDADGEGSASPTAQEGAMTPETTDPTGEATVEGAEPPQPTATATEEPPTETPTSEPTQTPSADPSGYRYPMDEIIHIPDKSSQLPNSARDYRCGYHEGVDFYPYDSGPFFGRDAPVNAARSGEVVRVDHQYSEYSTADREAELSRICAQGGTDSDILDHLRGRQVWITHDDGNTTRYCHLNSVNSALSDGQRIDAGVRVGGVGNSGTSNGALGTEMDIHLHFEVRLGGQDGPYLGSGQPESEVRRLLTQLFA